MKNVILCVIAPKGRGKTYFVSNEIQKMERVAVFDMIHEQAYSICEPVVGNPRQFATMMQPGIEQFRIAYRPKIFQNEERKESKCPELEPFIKLCYLRGDMWMVIDEAHLICNSRTCPDMLLTSNFLGRHRELSIVLIAQRFTGIHRDITSNADRFVFFKIVEPTELQGIRDRCGNEVMLKVQNLKALSYDKSGNAIPGEMLEWTSSDGVIDHGEGYEPPEDVPMPEVPRNKEESATE